MGVRCGSFLESFSLSAATINLHLSAVPGEADEAVEGNWLSAGQAIGTRSVEAIKRLRGRIGSLLDGNQAHELPDTVPQSTPAWQNRRGGDRPAARISGRQRSEAANLRFDQLQLGESPWGMIDMVGRGGRLRTEPVPTWYHGLIDAWLHDSRVTEGKLIRRVSKDGARQNSGVTADVV